MTRGIEHPLHPVLAARHRCLRSKRPGTAGCRGRNAGLIALAVAIVAILLKPSWRLLWLALPIAVTHIFLQIVCVWLIGDHHEAAALSAYAAALVAALAVAGYATRGNRLAAAASGIFALTYAWFAFEVSLFIF